MAAEDLKEQGALILQAGQIIKKLIKKIKIFKIKKALKWREQIYLEESQQQQEEK
ncbi:hypothetical protein TTHERM_00399630 (macronuclear) [Tetrahymena thermophila SB210]|uniref:Uncharacterized protein n=1 Tax=Tetrahymena thermophila (strain SB210) TaxID=312017 RepID=I7MIK6_TETTS|nr:hypothetical protein TTHERM_00399630 [Tetrahymena thermophila SB210]EAR93790.1 hypothetical protein TTHERM_00399630 [Tetrahymena thermophila SB210]|eukprot:XP_001014035.1 hypothetical protein TTHERM_00399630 [Tetrahymena thermophila SB210]